MNTHSKSKIHQKLIPYYVFLILAFIFLIFTDKAESYLVLTSVRSNYLDYFFRLLTNMGDGIFAILLVLIFLFIRLRTSIYLFLIYIISGLAVQILKRFVFSDHLRPVAWFRSQGIDIQQVANVREHLYHSFPSGHSATAFGIFIGLSLLTKNSNLRILLLVLAVLTGYSRVYLALHFPADVVGGAVIGGLTAVLCFSLSNRWKKDGLDISLLSLKRRSGYEV